MIPVFRDFFFPSEYSLFFSQIPPELPEKHTQQQQHQRPEEETLHLYNAAAVTGWSADPGQTQHAVVKVPVREDVRQAVIVVILLRVQLQKLLHADVSEAEGVGAIALVAGGVYLRRVQQHKAVRNQLLCLNNSTIIPVTVNILYILIVSNATFLIFI